MRRIAYICTDPGVPVFGRKGSSVHVQEVIRSFLRRGASVHLFARRFGGECPPDLRRLTWSALTPADNWGTDERERSLVALNAMLPDQLAAAGPFDMLYERHALWSHAALEWSRRQAIPSVLEVNAPLVDEQATHRSLHDRERAELIVRKAYLAATRIIAVSSGVAEQIRDSGILSWKIRVIGNGVDVGRFPDRRWKGDGAIRIGFVGTLKPWHGLPVLIDAVRLARNAGVPLRLLIVGDGPERRAVEQRLFESGLDHQTDMVGSVSPSDVPRLLAEVDIAVAPYPNLPGFYFSPLKIAEYMAAGCAILASRIGDIDGLITDEVNGLLCRPGDADSFASGIVRLHRDPHLRERLGAAARRKAARDLSWNTIAERILNLVEAAIPC